MSGALNIWQYCDIALSATRYSRARARALCIIRWAKCRPQSNLLPRAEETTLTTPLPLSPATIISIFSLMAPTPPARHLLSDFVNIRRQWRARARARANRRAGERTNDSRDFPIKSRTRTRRHNRPARSVDRLKTTARRITSNYFAPAEITRASIRPDFTSARCSRGFAAARRIRRPRPRCPRRRRAVVIAPVNSRCIRVALALHPGENLLGLVSGDLHRPRDPVPDFLAQ